MNQSELLSMTPEQRRKRLKQLAMLENANLHRKSDGRSANWGENPNSDKGGRPRIQDITKSQPAREMLTHSELGHTLAKTAETLGLTPRQAKRKARRYQISFPDWKYQE